jgi:hypothetical protein
MTWSQGIGPFSWVAGLGARLELPVLGPLSLLVGGGKTGGRVRVTDLMSHYEVAPTLPIELVNGTRGAISALTVPGNMLYRNLQVVPDEGVVLYGLMVKDMQPSRPYDFDYSMLPPVYDPPAAKLSVSGVPIGPGRPAAAAEE